MAVTNIKLQQAYDAQLVSVHQPLAIVARVSFTAPAPTECTAEISKNGDVIGVYRLIPYSSEFNEIDFVLYCDFLKAYMDSFDDIRSPEKVVHEQPHMTSKFQIKITCETESIITNLDLAHAVRQIGESPVLDFSGDFHFIGGAKTPVYVYFYNDDDGADISINEPTSANYAADDDLSLFVSMENDLLLIQ